MRVVGTINEKDNLCDYCADELPTCPKARHIKFGTGIGNDNIIECSEYRLKSTGVNYPIKGMPEYGVIERAEVKQ